MTRLPVWLQQMYAGTTTKSTTVSYVHAMRTLSGVGGLVLWAVC